MLIIMNSLFCLIETVFLRILFTVHHASKLWFSVFEVVESFWEILKTEEFAHR